MVTPDDDRGLHSSARDQLVDGMPRPRAVAVAEPADARRQPLERHTSTGEIKPSLEKSVLRKQLPELGIDHRDVGRVAGQCGPPKRADAAAEKRPDIRRDEARICECVFDSCLARLPSQVVAIIENIAARPDEREHRLDVHRYRLAGKPQILVGTLLAEARCLLERQLAGDVSGKWIVSRRLVGDQVEAHPPAGELRKHHRGVPEQPDR